MPKRLRCPTCKRDIEWSEQFPYRPFCSERCRIIDLGNWASEKYVISTPARPDDLRAQEDDDAG